MTLGKLRGPLGQLSKSLFVEGAGLVSEVALKGAKVSLELGNRCSKAALKGIENGALPLKDSSKKLGETFEEIGSEIAAQIRNSKLKKIAVTTVEEGKFFAKTTLKVGKEIKTELKETSQVLAQRMKVSKDELKEVGEGLAQKAKVFGSEVQEVVVSGKNKLCTPENFEKAKKAAKGSAALLIMGGLAAFSVKTAKDINDTVPTQKKDVEIEAKAIIKAKKAETAAKKAEEDVVIIARAKALQAEYEKIEARDLYNEAVREEKQKEHEAHLAQAAVATQEGSKSGMVERGIMTAAATAALLGISILFAYRN
jgi:hypothetical protein